MDILEEGKVKDSGIPATPHQARGDEWIEYGWKSLRRSKFWRFNRAILIWMLVSVVVGSTELGSLLYLIWTIGNLIFLLRLGLRLAHRWKFIPEPPMTSPEQTGENRSNPTAHREPRDFFFWANRLLTITGLISLAIAVFGWFANLQTMGAVP